MNTTVDLDSSNEGENLNPNIALVKPKREKGTGEKLGDTIELSSDDDSDISITEEKKPILKRSTAAFNSTKNDTIPISVTGLETSVHMQTPFLTPQSSTPATAYKSIITSTPAETPRFKLSNEEIENVSTTNYDSNQSNDYSENEKDTDDEENSSTTEEAVSKPNLSDTDEERSSDNDKMNTTYQNSETLKIDTQELQKSESTVHHNLDDSVDKIVDLQTNQQEHDVKLTKKEKSIHDGGDHPVLENDSPEIEEELYNSDSIDHKYNCKSSPKYYDKMENCSELINETPLLSQNQHNVIKDEICNDTSKRLQLSSSGDESDIEDDVTTQGKQGCIPAEYLLSSLDPFS